ncbi:Spx/MgsR family RNA polymerase-binding regulatory protein [Olsenella massiliensis]|uniref:Spx/MgsR family RNA polymerase-binding regulatory protein n=1 Tax=Olsenella massiliensis TaxID=1622075 RepID=UPI00071C6BB3|nr:Spx/MgsR family RNA polymerase-binding regulatory protein [Olsenella massiliensis]
MAAHDLTVIHHPRCGTCKRALRWLDERGVAYALRDIVAERPAKDELQAWQAASGLPPRRLFNTSGRLYRERKLKERLDAGISRDEACAILAEDGMLVRRPLVVGTRDDGTPLVLVGFKEARWQEELL